MRFGESRSDGRRGSGRSIWRSRCRRGRRWSSRRDHWRRRGRSLNRRRAGYGWLRRRLLSHVGVPKDKANGRSDNGSPGCAIHKKPTTSPEFLPEPIPVRRGAQDRNPIRPMDGTARSVSGLSPCRGTSRESQSPAKSSPSKSDEIGNRRRFRRTNAGQATEIFDKNE
jgi:hypothetical protein